MRFYSRSLSLGTGADSCLTLALQDSKKESFKIHKFYKKDTNYAE